jgi:hypothetical protein
MNVTVISPIESISFTDHFYVTYQGDMDTEWKPTVYPATATDYTLTWLSSNPEVAYVDENGELIRVSSGSTTIRATVAGTELYAELNITVGETAGFVDAKVTEMEYNYGYVYAVTSDGSLWMWGGGTHRVPTRIAEGVKDIAVTNNTSGEAYGYGFYVLHNDGTMSFGYVAKETGRYTPDTQGEYYKRISELSDVVNLYSYEYRTYYALRADGSVWV